MFIYSRNGANRTKAVVKKKFIQNYSAYTRVYTVVRILLIVFFHTLFQTIRIYPPLVAGRRQRKRSIYSEISNIIEISEYTVTNSLP